MSQWQTDTAWPEVIERALQLSDGARYVRCALQVNPWGYLVRHAKTGEYDDAATYHRAVVDACISEGIGAIAVADHHTLESAVPLLELAASRGIVAYPGFEARTKDGVHLLCIFDPSTDRREIERHLGELRLTAAAGHEESASLDAVELLARAHEWNAVVVAAHATNAAGLLKALSGRARIAAWTSPELLAAAIPAGVEQLPQDLRGIADNTNPDYRRRHPMALINAKDVCSPTDLASPRSWSWLKMSAPTIEGLRQAFLDPGSRVRLQHEVVPQEHPRIEVVTWEGGYLDGSALHLSENLNVLIGGRGAGKSTVVESVRFTFDLPSSGVVAASHAGFVKDVLGAGTRVSVLVRSPQPAPRRYLVQRSVGDAPSVWDEHGARPDLLPGDLMPGLEVYGQRELAELARSPSQRGRLLERFVDHDPSRARRLHDARAALEREGRRLGEIENALEDLGARLARLPALREQLRRFEEAGLEDRVRVQGLFTREQALLDRARQRIDGFTWIGEQVQEELPLDLTFLVDDALEGLPSAARLRTIRSRLQRLSAELQGWTDRGAELLSAARGDLEFEQGAWNAERARAQSAYDAALRAAGGAGAAFIDVRKEIEALQSVEERRRRLNAEAAERQVQRKALLDEWCELRRTEFSSLERAAKRISQRLQGLVRVTVTYEADRDAVMGFLRDHVGGRLDKVEEQLLRADTCSPRELAEACRSGPDVLAERYGIIGKQAGGLAAIAEQTLRALEILEPAPRTDVELNVGRDVPAWRRLEELSTGQKATALLLILLLHADGPLVVDQPEDDLDNAFIAEGIVPRLREAKQLRQFIFSTHNPNLPVLGDAELIVTLEGRGEPGAGGGTADPDAMGSIDDPAVRGLVATLLEGGSEAFERRRRRYGF